jgi:hypothetical protein
VGKTPKHNSATSPSLDSLPIIRIKDAWLLREHASKHLHELWGDGKVELADDTWMKRRVKEYIQAWQPYESRILSGMTETLGLSFRQNIIDVYIAPWFSAFSDPMVIGVTKKPDIFVDTLTHELIHRLLTDNTATPYTAPLLPEWEKLFGKQPTIVQLVHIPVHAVHKAIYLDILREPSRLQRDIKNNEEYGAVDYIEAWSYVEKHGYKTIIRKLRKLYTPAESR